jgi:ankyrin repeat protein
MFILLLLGAMLSSGRLYDSNLSLIDLDMKMLPKHRYLDDALQYAVQTNNIKMVEMLLNQGVDLAWKCNISGLNPLQSALKLQHLNVFKLLLDHGAKASELFSWMVNVRNRDPALVTVIQRHPEVLMHLFEHGVDPCANTCWSMFVDTLTYVSSDSKVDLERLYKVLLKKVVFPHENEKIVEFEGHDFIKCTFLDLRLVLLHNAIEAQSVSCVELLLEKRAPVNILSLYGKNITMLDYINNNNNYETPLHHACRFGDVEIVKLLLKNGAKFVRCEKEFTSLDVAYKKLSVDILRLFVTNGYVSESTRRYKLHVACLLEEVDRVRVMLDDGADVNKFDQIGRSPLTMAIYVKNMTLFKLLLKAGAQLNPSCEAILCDGTNCPASPIIMAIEYKNPEALDSLLTVLCREEEFIEWLEDDSRLTVGAARNGDLKSFDVLMKYRTNCVSRSDGFAPIHVAAQEGNLPMLKALVERGVCVNDNAVTEEHVHLNDGRIWEKKQKKFCHVESEEVDRRPLFLCKDAECIGFLLEKGADIHSVGLEYLLEQQFENEVVPLDELTPDHRARVLSGYRNVCGATMDSMSCIEPCPPYVKIIETGSVESMKAYFSSHKQEICKTSLVFKVACLAGKFELVRYLVSENPVWLHLLYNLLPLFTKPTLQSLFLTALGRDIEEEDCERKNGRVREDPICYIKMVGMLLDLGCTFHFKNLEILEEDDWFDDDSDDEENYEPTIEESDEDARNWGTTILSSSYDSQRFVFAKLLQEMCGRNLSINSECILRNMMIDSDYDMVLLLLNCGHKIDKESFVELTERLSKTEYKFQGFHDNVEDMHLRPLTLQSTCRIAIRRKLFQTKKEYTYINNVINKLPLPKPMQDYLSFSGRYELSYLMYESENTPPEHRVERPPPHAWQSPKSSQKQTGDNPEDCAMM